MMDATYVKAIADLAATQLFTGPDGSRHYSKPVHPEPLPLEPRVDPVAISTLAGFAEFLGSLDGFTIPGSDVEDNFACPGIDIVTVTERAVAALSIPYGVTRKRECFAVATPITPMKAFDFGKYYDLETFMVLMQTCFQRAESWEGIVRVLGTIKDEKVSTSQDDGITQTVTARVGIALAANAPVPNPVTLRPFRTFPEVEQPASPFILRLQSGSAQGAKPTAALFEADGGAWKLEAIRNIKAFLEAASVGARIVA